MDDAFESGAAPDAVEGDGRAGKELEDGLPTSRPPRAAGKRRRGGPLHKAVKTVSGLVVAITGGLKGVAGAVATTTTGVQRAVARNVTTLYEWLPAVLHGISSDLDRDDIDEISARIAKRLVRKQQADPWYVESPAALKRFASKVARQHAIREERQRGRRSGPEGQHDSERADSVHTWDSPGVAVEEAELLRVAALAVAAMPWKRRAAYEAIDVERMSYAEAAEKLGLKISSIESHVARAHRELAKARAAYDNDRPLHGWRPALQSAGWRLAERVRRSPGDDERPTSFNRRNP